MYSQQNYGLTGSGPLGTTFYVAPGPSGPTASMNQSIQQLNRQGDNLLMYSDKDKHKIIDRFYHQMQEFYMNEQSSKQKIEETFDLLTMSMSDPQEMAEGFYYKQAIGLFYLLNKKRENIWFRDDATMINILCDERSGSIYFSPFTEDCGMIYLGSTKIINKTINTNASGSYFTSVVETKYYCFVTESLRSIFYCNDWSLERLKNIRSREESLLREIRFKDPVKEFSSLNVSGEDVFLADLILSGKLSDACIECVDGKVNVSRAMLCMHSEYFVKVFANTLFMKQEVFQVDFHKQTLESYIYYLCNQRELEGDLIEMIQFSNFIFDRRFMKDLYDIADERSRTSKDIDYRMQLQIVSLYKTMGFKFV
jgi:hypothetical protein